MSAWEVAKVHMVPRMCRQGRPATGVLCTELVRRWGLALEGGAPPL
jgi:hypothetical protein